MIMALNTGTQSIRRTTVTKISRKDVAIIGMAGSFSVARNLEEFWDVLVKGQDGIREFPHERRTDAMKMLPNAFMPADPPRILEAGYLEEVDKFDHRFFNLSLNEAKLIDPHQRMFLSTVWSALEDAAYAGKSVRGSNTGVFVGHSTDLMYEYFMYVNKANPAAFENISLPGNVRSIIASRISYLLDFRGPAVCLDTACSSALVAVYQACRALRAGECDMAIAGGININHLPVQYDIDNEIGIRSPSNRVKAFDDAADGIGSGEGVAALVLKPLHKAMNEHDHIYAVIKGGAVNHDGNSIGITAPDRDRQEEVLVSAWKNAGVDPETITMLEAHGTGTRLGDPIEVSAIEKAFRNFTQRKAFCALGSVKSNIGHLDNLAGMPSLIKTVLAMQHAQIPPSINFKRPNQQINFIDSPVYVNDKLSEWVAGDAPRRCGVSSFGLSGTNCHLILEEYTGNTATLPGNSAGEEEIFTLSAQDEEVLWEYIVILRRYLSTREFLNIRDICFSLNTGRMHWQHRLLIVVKSTRELITALQGMRSLEDCHSGNILNYAEHRIVPPGKKEKNKGEISEAEKQELSRICDTLVKERSSSSDREIVRYYLQGADVDWDTWYAAAPGRRISLPAYPRKRIKCWVDITTPKGAPGEKTLTHPLLTRILSESLDQDIYLSSLDVNVPVLRDHKIAGNYVLPGTAFIEILREVLSFYTGDTLVFQNLIFLSPFIVEDRKDLQTVIIKRENGYGFKIISRKAETREWEIHVEGSCLPGGKDAPAKIDMLALKNRFPDSTRISEADREESIVSIGPRWTSIRRELFQKGREYLVTFDNSSGRYADLEEYFLYPPLLDRCVNALNLQLDKTGYIPLFYKQLVIYGPTPRKCASLFRLSGEEGDRRESLKFDITLLSEEGRVFAEIEGYTVKKIGKEDFKRKYIRQQGVRYYQTGWKESHTQTAIPGGNGALWMVIKTGAEICAALIRLLRFHGHTVIEVELGTSFRKKGDTDFEVAGRQEDFDHLFSLIPAEKLQGIVHMSSLQLSPEPETQGGFTQDLGILFSAFYLSRTLVRNTACSALSLVFVAESSHFITPEEDTINPLHNALFTFGKALRQEAEKLNVYCLDLDALTTAETVYRELMLPSAHYLRGFRAGKRYIQVLREVSPESFPRRQVSIREEGAYVIIGGLGGLGCEIGRYLCLEGKVNLCLLGREKLPPRDLWDSLSASCADTAIRKKIRNYQALTELAAELRYYPCDVSDYEALAGVLPEIRKTFGKINGVVQCAGLPGSGFIFHKKDEDFRQVLLPKIQGTWNLGCLTEKDELDFFVLFSSVASLFAGPGESDYAAANGFLDSYASYLSGKGRRVLAINWPAWRETGMAHEHGIDEEGLSLHSITPGEAMTAFSEMINLEVSRLAVGTLNYSRLRHEGTGFDLSGEIENEMKQSATGETPAAWQEQGTEEDVKLSGSNSAYSFVEQRVAALWSKILGLAEVNVYESFNSLGGDSILATRLLKLLEQEFPGMVDIADIFNYSTVNEMAAFIEGKMMQSEAQEEPAGDDDIDIILNKLASGEVSINDLDN